MSFCLVAMIGVLPVGLRQEQLSSEKQRAFEAITAVATDLKVNTNPGQPDQPSQSPRYRIDFPKVTAGAVAKSDSFLLTERFDKTDDISTAVFKVWYEITPPVSRYDCYVIHLSVSDAFSTRQAGTAQNLQNKDFIESVISKSVF